MTNLCFVSLTYVSGPEKADEHMDAHREFLRAGYADGIFLASGRKEPRTGGVVLAAGSRNDVERRFTDDPFHIHGVAEYTVTEFVPTMTSDALDVFRVEA